MARATKALGRIISGFRVGKEMDEFFIYLKENEELSRNNYIRRLIDADMKDHKALNGKKFNQWSKKRRGVGDL